MRPMYVLNVYRRVVSGAPATLTRAGSPIRKFFLQSLGCRGRIYSLGAIDLQH